MYYHIILTQLCNSQCKYCYEKSLKDAELENDLGKKFKFDFSEPDTSEVDVSRLKKFIRQDKDAVLIFYGGEPLLEIEKIKKIIEEIHVPLRMQTNGKLLNKLEPKYLHKISKILVSIDGDKNRTDTNKGEGTYDQVIENLRFIRARGYKGELIARMTIEPDYGFDIYEQVVNLLDLGLFDSIHWQLDAGFYKHDYKEKEFQEFIEKYNKKITKLLDLWIDQMHYGKVLKFYPFLQITQDLLENRKTKLRCGAGYAGYAITTTGKIIACPIMNSIVDFEAGDLKSHPEDLKKFEVGGKCLSCDIKDLCGGRCLYENKAQLWPKYGQDLICSSIRHLIKSIEQRLPEIKSLLSKKKIELMNFNHERFFGPEIIP